MPSVPPLARAVLAGLCLAAFGAVAVATHTPALFPALGPSLYLLAVHPDAPAAHWRRIGVGHGTGLAVGLGCRAAFGPAGAASLSALTPADAMACAVALLVTVAVLPRLDADHPPAAATTLIAALGAFGEGWRRLAVLGAVAVLAGGAAALGRSRAVRS